MGCVNTSSKEFKALASRHNLDSGTLEVLVHKYWLETGNETLFPTDVYVQAHMGNVQYREPGKNVRKLWDKRYSHPLVFSSMKTLSPALKNARRFFPQGAINYYKDAKGNYVLSIMRPMAKVSHDKDAFFKEYDSAGSTKNIKTLNLGITEGKTYGIDKVQQLFSTFNTDRTSKELASKVFDIAKELGLQITFDESLPNGVMGRYTNNNTIRIKKSFLERNLMNDKKASIMLHEVIHAISTYALSDQINSQEKSKALNQFKEEVTSLYDALKANPILKGDRAITNVTEFVAELANPVFREKIKNIDRENNAAKKIEKKSFWSRIVDAFKKLLGLHVTSDYYQRSMNALDKALNAFDIDTYMRYNGIKNTLRQGYNAKEWEFNSMTDEQLKSKVDNYFDSKVYNEELLSLKKKAIENGTFMKAPNGKPTKLSEKQWLQVRTQSFKEWFGDWENNPESASKVVDENGEPLVVYHGGAKGIKVFQHSSEKDSTTGYGYYTDKKTGEKIPIDSNRTIFFSSNPFVGTSYATMYGIQQFQKLLSQTENILYNSNKETGLHFTTEEFKKGLNDFYEFLTNASEINPRFEALKSYIQDLKAIGKRINKVNEREAVLEMLKDLRKKLQDYTSHYLMNRSEWENIYSNAAKVIDEYNNPEGVKRLIKGEIPEVIQKEWTLYKKIEAQREKEGKDEIDNYKSIHLTLGEGRYYFVYNGKELKILNPNYTDPKVSTMTEEELSQFLADAKNANLLGFKELREDTNYQAVKNKAQEYAVFLNLRNPISHDYEGTHQGEGYKQSQKYSFGYIAARQVNKAFTEGKDGVIYQNLYDPYLADNYGVFNPNQVKSATDNTGEFSTSNPEIYNYELGKEFVDSMSGKQLKNELSIIKQESFDYDIVNNIEPEHKHSGKAVPQDFTFADGTTIKAPFKPNEQQAAALNVIDDFIKSDEEPTMTLSGYAGTGKTSLMEMIAKKATKDGYSVRFCASTNKAAAVLKDKVSKAGFEAFTVNKIFGIRVESNPDSKQYDAKKVVNVLKNPLVDYGEVVIIDEASMINEGNYKTLNDIAKRYALKLIYVGDEAQLAPVGETKVSKVFRNGDGKVVRLTQVERTDDNAILKEATDIRNDKPLSGESSFNSKGEGVAYVKPQNKEVINELLEKLIPKLHDNPNYFRILAYHNATVSEYNTKVRSILGYDSPAPRVGEPMVGYSNWGYMWQTGTYKFINSEAYKVKKVGKPQTVPFAMANGNIVHLEVLPITLTDSMGNTDTFNYIDIKNNLNNRKAATILATRKSQLWNMAKGVVGKQAREYHQELNRIEEFLFVNDDIKAPDGERTLQSKVIDFGYAMTVHKSQGSTFTHVLVDDVDIARGAREEVRSNISMEDVSLGETPQDLSDMTVTLEDGLDLTDAIPSSTEETKSQDPNQVDKRQQLEYVAVSRATDTVTIISNNVKKESSPLHPENAIKEENNRSDNKNQSNESNNTRNAEKQPTILDQVISQLKSIGISVRGRDAMAEFLKTHKLEYLQQVIDNNDQSNTLSKLDEAIRTGNWTDEAVDTLEDLKIEEYGKILKRFSQEELRKSNGILTQAASIIARGDGRADQKNTSTDISRRAKQQEQQIESWAKKAGLWYNNYRESKDGSLESVIEADGGKLSDESGSESMVYFMKNSYKDGVTKVIDASHYTDSPQSLLDKIILHNSLFPETAYEVIGFGRDRGGTFRVIVKQRFVKGEKPTVKDIQKLTERLGLTKKGGWYYTADGKRISDLNSKNVIKVPATTSTNEDTFFVIDCDVEFTKEYLQEQSKESSQSVSINQDAADLSFFIGKKARDKFEQSLRKQRPDMSDAEIESTLDFLHSLADDKENTAYIKTAVRWVANRSITLPQDNTKARQAFDLARKKHIDLQKYNTLGELINAPEMQPKEKEKQAFNPDTAKTFSNKQIVTTKGGRIFTVYDVENTYEGQREVCKALAAHYKMSPWCLSTFTSKGEPTESAKRYWERYNAIPRKIAFENGEPVAFSSSDSDALKGDNLTFRGVHASETFSMLYLTEEVENETLQSWLKEGVVEIDDGTPKPIVLTPKGEAEVQGIQQKEEAWWDMEDTYEQNSLSDSIVGKEKKESTEDDVIGGELERVQNNQEHLDRENQVLHGNGRIPLSLDDFLYEEFGLPFFTTPQGEVYGFVDKDGNIYLDETKISPEHGIHEYAHLWDRIVQQKNPKLWQKGIELMKQLSFKDGTSMWEAVLNDDNYGKVWQSMNIPQEKLESLVASEIHARITGKGGEQLLEKLAKEKGQSGIIEKLKQWILDVWKDLKATFGDWSQEDLDKLTIKDFNHMTVRDFAEGINLKEATNATYTKDNTSTNKEAIPIETVSTETTSTEAVPIDDRQDVSLPNYEKAIGAYESPYVSEWKVPYLKELDSQLNDEKTKEEKGEILKQMDLILSSTSKEDFQHKLEESKIKDSDKMLNTYKILNDQIDNLLEGKDAKEWEVSLTNTEIRNIVEMLMNDLSDLITDLQTQKGLANKLFPWLKTKKDFLTLSRREVVDVVGLDSLMDVVKRLLDPMNNDYPLVSTDTKAQICCDNWQAIMFLASDYLALNEGFGMSLDYKKGIYVAESKKVNLDALRDVDSDSNANDSDIKEEEGRDDPEGYQIDMKTVDIINTMSQLVKQGLRGIYKLDKNNNKIKNEFDREERINVKTSTNSILKWCQGAKTLSEMVERLKQKQPNNPWVSQLITRLSDTSGKDTEFQSQFYGIFSKAFQNYCIVKDEKGKWVSMNVNNHTTLSNAFSAIASQFNIGEHPLFTGAGKVRLDKLGTKNAVGPNDPFTLWKAKAELEIIKERLRRDWRNPNLKEEERQKAVDIVTKVYEYLGFPVTRDIVAEATTEANINEWWRNLMFITRDLDKANILINASKLKYKPFTFKSEHSIENATKNFLAPVTDILDATAPQSFYNNGKMYQNYVAPSFLTKLTDSMNLKGQKLEDFIMKEYGSSEWFYDKEKGEWRCELIDMLLNNYQGMFDHKIELDFNTHGYMKRMTPEEYKVSLIAEYISDNASIIDDMAPAWFRVPMQSNKPSNDFIRLPSFRTGGIQHYKTTITEHLYDIVKQEIMRIKTVNKRNLSKGDPEFIANFDSNGRRFCFFPILNAYLDNSSLAKKQRNVLSSELLNNQFAELLQKKVKGEEALTSEEMERFDQLAQEVIRKSTENKVQSMMESWEKDGIIEVLRDKLKGLFPKEISDKKYKDAQYKRAKEWVENYMWNDTLASKWILELTITDLAFYKNADDLQKRLSELHSSGTRANIEAPDPKGNLVSDGKYRTVVIKDYDTFKSNIIDNITEVFNRRIAEAETPAAKKSLEVLKDSLVRPRTYNADGTIKDAGGAYYNINVADAQGFSGLSSYRKKAIMFGKWDKAAEKIFEKIKTGDYDYSDLQKVFQPLKPFVYTKEQKNVGVEGSPISTLPVPFQAKNSEYLILMADGLLHNEETSRPNLLRALFRVMEESERINPTKGIDTIQFESAIKSGLQGAIDINKYLEMPGGEEGAFTAIMESIYKETFDKDGKRVYKDYDVDTYVHEMSYEGYMSQQEIPAHFKDHYQAEGSQIRALTAADLDPYTYDANGNQVENLYTYTDIDNKGKKVKKSIKADEFRKELEETIAANINQDLQNLITELHLDIRGSDPKDIRRNQNLALSKILQAEIASSPRYGIDLLQACAIDDKTGEFRIPKGDPIQAKRIEQLINSIIKSRCNKQRIKGGPLVQVTNYGASKKLNIRFNDKEGNLMPTEAEYKPEEHDNLSYEEYRKKNQGGIAYFEAMIPIWSNEIYEKFSNVDGTINVDAIEALDPDLLKMICYRIPTEDKYSCTPIKVVGFLPKEAGDCIMLPYELTTIDGSDYDIDKRYLMMKDIDILPNNPKNIRYKLLEKVKQSYERTHDSLETLEKKKQTLLKKEKSDRRDKALEEVNKSIAGTKAFYDKVYNLVDDFIDSPLESRTKSKFYASLWKAYQKVAYRVVYPKEGKYYNNNKIFEMTYAALTNERSADKTLNPGNFENVKSIAYKIAAYKNLNAEGVRWKDLEDSSIEDLKKKASKDKDLTFIDTQVEFYEQNAAATSLIGILAVHRVAQAMLQNDGIFIDINKATNNRPFSIGGHFEGENLVDAYEFKGLKPIDGTYDRYGNLVGKVLASLAGASVDAVKDPVLNLLNINPTTANILTTMIRLGIDLNTAALFLSQDIIGRVLSYQNSKSLTKFTSLADAIEEWMSTYRKNNSIVEDSPINNQPLTEEELIEGLTSKEHQEIDYKVLHIFQKLWNIAEEMRKPTLATRFNSISSAVGPLVIDNVMKEAKLNNFREVSNNSVFCTADGASIDINYIFDKHPSLKAFYNAYSISQRIFADTPVGSNTFQDLLNTFPKDIKGTLLKDKKLLNKFSDFYSSYLVIQSGLVDQANLKEMIEEFPKTFNQKYKKNKEYKDNPLIQAIQLDTQKGKVVLSIKLIGMDSQEKDLLSSGWVDLHNQDPELSKKLFDYCFFRAGIGFSPKTFMSLVPVYVKERLKSADGKTSYVDTFRKIPSVELQNVVTQFIRNNWNEYKIVPLIKDGNFIYDWNINQMRVEDPVTRKQCKTYIRTKVGKEEHLWVKDPGLSTNDYDTYRHIEPLGNNGEYLEISKEEIVEAMQKTTATSEETETPIEEESTPESNIESPHPTEPSKESLQEQMLQMMAVALPGDDRATILRKYTEARASVLAGQTAYGVFLQNVALKNGYKLDKADAIEWFKKFC